MITAFFGFSFLVCILLLIATLKDLLPDEDEIKFQKDMLEDEKHL